MFSKYNGTRVVPIKREREIDSETLFFRERVGLGILLLGVQKKSYGVEQEDAKLAMNVK